MHSEILKSSHNMIPTFHYMVYHFAFNIVIGMILTVDEAGDLLHYSVDNFLRSQLTVCRHPSNYRFHLCHDIPVDRQWHFLSDCEDSSGLQRISCLLRIRVCLPWTGKQFQDLGWNQIPWKRKKNNLLNWLFNTIHLKLIM